MLELLEVVLISVVVLGTAAFFESIVSVDVLILFELILENVER